METDVRYYRRRACEEMSAATRAVTPAARDRRLHLVGIYLDRLKAMNAPSPFEYDKLSNSIEIGKSGRRSAFAWQGKETTEPA